MRKDNRAFTLVEVIVTLSLGISLLLGVIFIPVNISKYSFIVKKDLNYYTNYSTISTALSTDIFKSLGQVKTDNSDLLIIDDGLYYEFKDDGLYRVKEGNTSKISGKRLKYEVIGENKNILAVKEISEEKMDEDAPINKLDLYFNLDFGVKKDGDSYE
jgi:type II secretory pathway pseudopilin PulG